MSEPLPPDMAPSDTMMRGSKIRIWPKAAQAQTMDLWRRRCIQLWNLLLELEQAAYSGENRKSRLGWRSIWARVVEESHASAVEVFRNGKPRKDGTMRKEPGQGREPAPLDNAVLAKITREAIECDPETGEPLPARLFLWEHELQKVMARLKQVPRTEWIADLPSHAAQAVVKDLIKALQAMLRERKKRVSGAGGRDTGFPKFKKQRYAAGSVYFANTQLKFDFEKNRVQIPNGVGWMPCEIPMTIRLDASSNTSWRPKLMGGRAWRQGEEWFLSCQWEMRRPPALPKTGRTAGVKVAAGILLTTYDDRGQTREYVMPPADKTLLALHKQAGQKLARVMTAHKRREKTLTERKARRLEQLAERGIAPKPIKRPRIKRTPGFYAASARLARLEAAQRDARDDFLHKLTTDVVRRFDAISVQTWEVAELMKKPSAKRQKRHEKAAGEEKSHKPGRPMKPVRKMMRRAAPARALQLLKYKALDLRGPDAFIEIGRHDVNVSACSGCGTIHPEMKDGRPMLRCAEVLADGTICGTALLRNRNAARVSKRELDARQSRQIR